MRRLRREQTFLSPESSTYLASAAAAAARGIARLAVGKPPMPVPRPCSPRFIWAISGIGISLYRNLTGPRQPGQGIMQMWQLHDYLFVDSNA
jgi:hypothetical protein